MPLILTKHFVMKRSFVFILASFYLVTLVAQAPYYIMFNTNFMDQLEYKYTYQGNVVNVYGVKPSPTESFLLTTANEGITSPTQPKGAVTYRDLRSNTALLDMVNNHTRPVFVVHPRTSGDFLLMPIISATYVVRNGAFYMVSSPTYSFALDTTHLINETNLATGRSPSYVYFTGMKFRDCRVEYAFRREPSRTNTERSDFDFMPGLGITSERSGKNATDAETNHMRLVKVDGIPLDDYLNQTCSDTKTTPPNTISPYTPKVDYGNTPPPVKGTSNTPYKEYNKEDVAIRDKALQKTNATREAFDFNKCLEQPGKGYHIVQPGDNLKAIARTYSKNEQDLISWNKIKNPNLIEVCQKIWLMKPPKTSTSAKQPAVPAGNYNARESFGAKTVIDQSTYWNETQEQTSPAARTYNTNSKSPEYYGPANNVTKVAPAVAAVTPMIYKVRSGDYLYKIAREHGCIEECIRRANKFPLEGDIMLWPGQELIIPECTCTLPATPTNGYETPTKNTNAYYNDNYYAPQTGNPNLIAKSPADAYYKPQGYNSNNTPVKSEPSNNAGNYSEDRPESGNNDTEDTYFTEHIVKVGDTLNSIGYHYRTNAAELAQLNNLKPNDPLVPGVRLLIPHKK